MTSTPALYILGLGAVGLPLAAFLAREGRNVVAVRTRPAAAAAAEHVLATVRDGLGSVLNVPLETRPLSTLIRLDGIVVVTAKSYANASIAAALKAREITGPLVVLQNGVGVEDPFLEAGFGEIYRCVLYVTSRVAAPLDVAFRPIGSSPVGIVAGQGSGLEPCVAALTTPGFPFHAEKNIRREVWKKAIINAAFNSICPLLDVDNGVFARDAAVAGLAREIVREGLALAAAQGAPLDEPEVMAQILRISRGSDGVPISTLQDIRSGRPTEIETLNLAMARLAAAASPAIDLTRTELLGKMILAKSRCHRAPAGE